MKLPSILGLYGDFIGGVFGTVVAVLSVFYLIRTLKEQESANSMVAENNLKVIEVYNQQQFNDKCQNLLSLYNEIKGSYIDVGTGNKETLNNIAAKLFNGCKSDKSLNYSERLDIGKNCFNTDFYTVNRTVAAVHFRVLYQLFGLIFDFRNNGGDYSVPNDEYASSYSKLVRSQLNESELVLLRYNCYCGYGKKMIPYINQYNLLKHLPIMSLCEFKRWSDIFGTGKENLRNALDTELIAQRKWLKTFFEGNFDGDKREYSRADKKYSIGFFADKDKKSFKYCIVRNDDINVCDEVDKAFKEIDDELPEFMNDFMHEAFEYSNFREFNDSLDYEERDVKTNKDMKITTFTVSVTSTIPIVMSQSQMETRNPQEMGPVKMEKLKTITI